MADGNKRRGQKGQKGQMGGLDGVDCSPCLFCARVDRGRVAARPGRQAQTGKAGDGLRMDMVVERGLAPCAGGPSSIRASEHQSTRTPEHPSTRAPESVQGWVGGERSSCEGVAYWFEKRAPVVEPEQRPAGDV